MLNIKKIIPRRYLLTQYYYYFFDKFFSKSSETKKLIKDGFCIHNKKFPIETLNFGKYINYENFNFVHQRKKIDLDDLKKISKYLNKFGIINIIKEYLGASLFLYDNTILTLGTEKSSIESWQPHHDNKGRRIKIYIWLDNINYQTHPLYYKKGTNKNIINMNNYSDSRLPNKIGVFEKIYGNLGDIIIFDTHGVHSNFKVTTQPRSVVELTFEAKSFFNRINNKRFNAESARLVSLTAEPPVNVNDLINE